MWNMEDSNMKNNTQNNFIDIGNRLKMFRNEMELTQEQISAIIEVSTKYWSEVERGVQGPSREFLLKLITKFDISADYLLIGTVAEKTGNMLVEEYMKCPEKFREEFLDIVQSIRKILEKL